MFVSRGSTTSYSIKSCVKAQRQQKLKSERLLGQSAECQRLLRKAVKSRRPSTLHAMLIGQVKQSRSRSVKCWGSFTYDKGDILLSVADSLQSKMDGLQSQLLQSSLSVGYHTLASCTTYRSPSKPTRLCLWAGTGCSSS
eukprot:jgi/Botrbrau1/16276/Bobra.0066s0057.5